MNKKYIIIIRPHKVELQEVGSNSIPALVVKNIIDNDLMAKAGNAKPSLLDAARSILTDATLFFDGNGTSTEFNEPASSLTSAGWHCSIYGTAILAKQDINSIFGFDEDTAERYREYAMKPLL